MQCLDDAKEELKRVDHLIYVSLKYTRTTDVLLNIIKRMIDAYQFLLEALLRKALEEKKIEEIPTTPKERCNVIKRVYEDKDIHEHVDMFLLLRQITKTEYTSENEYRRHVTLITYIGERREILNIDLVSVYYENLLKFYDRIKIMAKNE
jgi:hypothetical protein